jgi:hypothetical protein
MGRPALCLLLAGCACILLAGCAGTLLGYPGDRLPEEEVAVIVSRSASAVRVGIVDLDGAALDEEWGRGDRLELTPGRHSLTLELTWRPVPAKRLWPTVGDVVEAALAAGINAAASQEATVGIDVDVEAGKRYALVVRVASEGEAEYEVTEDGTGVVVASRRVE